MMRVLAVALFSLFSVGVEGGFWIKPRKSPQKEVAIYDIPRYGRRDTGTADRGFVDTTHYILADYPSVANWQSTLEDKTIAATTAAKDVATAASDTASAVKSDIGKSEFFSRSIKPLTVTRQEGMLPFLSRLCLGAADKAHSVLGSIGTSAKGSMPAMASAEKTTGKPEFQPRPAPLTGTTFTSTATAGEEKHSDPPKQASTDPAAAAKETTLSAKASRAMNHYKGALFPRHLDMQAYSPFPSVRRQTRRALAPLFRHLEAFTDQARSAMHQDNAHWDMSGDLMKPAALFLQMMDNALHPHDDNDHKPSSPLTIPFDTHESLGSYRIVADVPAGVTAADITVDLTAGEDATLCTVTITRDETTTTVDDKPLRAQDAAIATKLGGHKVVHRERQYGRFRRAFELPADVTADEKGRITATVNRKHELEITIPRKQQSDPVHLEGLKEPTATVEGSSIMVSVVET
jgi:HSP20 family molecular chaperone IbpA